MSSFKYHSTKVDFKALLSFQKRLHFDTGSTAKNIFRHLAGWIVMTIMTTTMMTTIADGVGTAGGGDSDDNPDGGARKNKVRPVLA